MRLRKMNVWMRYTRNGINGREKSGNFMKTARKNRCRCRSALHLKALKNLIISEAMQISHNVRSTEWIQGEVAVREPSVFFATVRLMTGLQKIFQEEFRKENRTGRYHIDRKRRKKLTERRRAQGHRTDDHEPEQQIEG